MKICPRCQKTYNDDGLNFCLDDGAVLEQAAAADNSLPATVFMNQPRPTNPPPPPIGGQSATPPANWNNPNQISMPPPAKKKSKGWLWALLILGGLMLICGGGFIGLLFMGANLDNANNKYNDSLSNNKNSVLLSNRKNGNLETVNSTNRSQTQKIDLSRWTQGDADLGTTKYDDGKFLMGSKKKGYYYVLCTKGDEYKTENATTKVTVKNINEADTSLGFGFVIHSNPKPLQQDYAFLIDSENQKYRVVRHKPGEEIIVVGWTRSAAIKNGTQENVLEVRDENKKMSFYINDELVKTVTNTDGYAGGVTGLYSGDAVEIAFSDFEIVK